MIHFLLKYMKMSPSTPLLKARQTQQPSKTQRLGPSLNGEEEDCKCLGGAKGRPAPGGGRYSIRRLKGT